MVEHAYIHIPFCLRKCKYCSFVSGVDISHKKEYLAALLKEIQTNYKGEELKTVYIGGGTPSLLSPDDIYDIISLFKLVKNAEITVEVNPETVSFEKMEGFKNAGVNRVSLGIQSFDNNILKLIGRGHSANQAKQSVSLIKEAQINNISIDLIYGLPEQSLQLFKKDLEEAKKLEIVHISTYGLKIEESSYFYDNRPKNIADDDIQAEMYNYLCDFLNDFEHYEISNFARNGYLSQHNCSYWLNKNYYGFGLNASGYEQNIRYKNASDFNKYIENPFIKEEKIELTKEETLENEIFLSLRLRRGVNISEINSKYEINFSSKYGEIIDKYTSLGLLESKNNFISLSRQGILLSNEIMSEFINI